MQRRTNIKKQNILWKLLVVIGTHHSDHSSKWQSCQNRVYDDPANVSDKPKTDPILTRIVSVFGVSLGCTLILQYSGLRPGVQRRRFLPTVCRHLVGLIFISRTAT